MSEEAAMSEEEEWMRAEDALAYLGVPRATAADTICTRAYNGMIKARAKRYISPTGRASDDVEVPREFWRERGDITASWRAGDFETTALDAQMSRVQAFGVMFRRSDIEQIRPASTAASTGGAPSSSTQAPAPTDGEWMSAQEALDFLLTHLRMGYGDAVSTLCTRANVGLIKARAKLFIHDGEPNSDADVPPEFWEGREVLEENWVAGDFETSHDTFRLQAFGVEFRRSDIERMKPASAAASAPATSSSPAQTPAAPKVFIGHGHSSEWRKLSMFLHNDHDLRVIEFNSSSPVGISTPDHLQDMLNHADFAFLILTGEDEQSTGELNPRLNVVHEAGLFQGRLGFRGSLGCQTA